ncbi:MAG: MBL fold metallo-hydrolase [Lachnospiraceae bacterium]|jgi:L-ascorbate metabolism protein UlaG (beta-lactamase superfamily)|nr:MBL fold metallo-hydrolase [Lachnospiraceae bacterium]
MKVTYLKQSGFLVEWGDIYCLFDYYLGTIPSLDENKELYVFVSHAHADHYNREIWSIFGNHPRVRFIVSKEVPLSPSQRSKLGLKESDRERIVQVRADEVYQVEGINEGKDAPMTVRTARSTDAGVAFLVEYAGQTVFHAGDLNLWVWEEESEAGNADMTRRFMVEMDKLKGVHIDVAFFPLDPRQGKDCGAGLEIFNRTAVVRCLFPMHLWNRMDTVVNYLEEAKQKEGVELGNIMVVRYEGQSFEC